MTRAASKILTGARQALAAARGDASQGRVTRVKTAGAADVAKTRRRLRLSQAEFAAAFGVSVATVRDWEQRRRKPSGPARVLLALIEREPGTVRRMLG